MVCQHVRTTPAKIILAFYTIGFTCTVKLICSGPTYNVFHLEDDTTTMSRLNTELEFLNRVMADLEWKVLKNSSAANFRLTERFSELKTIWRNQWCEQLQQLDYYNTSSKGKKMITLLCRGPKYTSVLARQTTALLNELSAAYALSTVCRIENNKTKCYNGEPDLAKLMSTSRNESELRWAWTAWHDEMSKVKNLYTTLIKLENIAARNNGYNDIGDCWKEEFEIPHMENYLETVYQRVRLLYKLLHAVVRFRLAQVYPNVDKTKPIPAHLLGNLWSQNWESLIDIILPDYSNVITDLTTAMKRKNYTVHTMIRKAEEFYESLGFPPLTRKFWENSVFEGAHMKGLNCHATAANMYKDDDFRMFACLETKAEDLQVVYHEIGHIQYYMAYQNQPTIFKDGVNAAFHEAIGDSIMYGVASLQHLQRLGLVNESFLNPKHSTNLPTAEMLNGPITRPELAFLLRQALIKLPQLSSGIALEKWRWEVFRGRITSTKYNKLWWKLHRQYMGIAPPLPRSDHRFDAAAKFHIANNIPYSRYFLANILQVQLFQGMCEAAVTGKVGDAAFDLPLYKCDIYGSKSATERLRSLMKQGSSIDWMEALRIVTGFSDFLVEPLLKYYEPVRKWLEYEIKRYDIPIGWY